MYTVDGRIFATAESATDFIREEIPEGAYDDMLSEIYGDVQICGLSYDAACALKEIDPVAYRCGFIDWKDGEYRDIVYQLERMSDGETDTFYGIEVERTITQVLTNSKDAEIQFTDLDESKDYFLELANDEEYAQEIKDAESLEDLVDVLNAY